MFFIGLIIMGINLFFPGSKQLLFGHANRTFERQVEADRQGTIFVNDVTNFLMTKFISDVVN